MKLCVMETDGALVRAYEATSKIVLDDTSLTLLKVTTEGIN